MNEPVQRCQPDIAAVRRALDGIQDQCNEMRSLKGWRMNLIRDNLMNAYAALGKEVTHIPDAKTAPMTTTADELLVLADVIEEAWAYEPAPFRRAEVAARVALDFAAARPRCDVQREGETFTAQDAWDNLVHKDDRTSPEEYPDMCLITFEELQDYITRALSSPVPSAERGGK